MAKEYLQPCPLSWVHEQLQSKAERDERFTEMDAAQSLLLDRLRDIERSKSAYARLWGWPRSTLYDRWDDVEEQAQRQRTFYSEDAGEESSTNTKRRHPTDTPSDNDRHPLGQKEPNTADEGANADTPSDTDRHPTDTLPTPYIPESLDNTDKEESVVEEVERAGAREDFEFVSSADWEAYGKTIQLLAQKYSPQSVDRMVLNQWGKASGAIPHADFAELARGHPWPKVVAATVITANSATKPNMKYLRKVLKGFDEDNHAKRKTTTTDGSGSAPGVPEGRGGGQWGEYARR